MVAEDKQKEVAPADAELSTRRCVTVFDRSGGRKARVERTAGKALSGKTALACALVTQAQRSCAIRVEAEPASFRWDSTLQETEGGPSSAFLGEKRSHYNDLERKNGQEIAQKPRREKMGARQKRVEGKMVCIACTAQHARQELCSPH